MSETSDMRREKVAARSATDERRKGPVDNRLTQSNRPHPLPDLLPRGEKEAAYAVAPSRISL
jgi:hypothetical protein